MSYLLVTILGWLRRFWQLSIVFVTFSLLFVP